MPKKLYSAIDTSMDYNKAEEVIGNKGAKILTLLQKLPKLDKNNFIAEQLEKVFKFDFKTKKSLHALLLETQKIF